MRFFHHVTDNSFNIVTDISLPKRYHRNDLHHPNYHHLRL